jgi:ABC-type amino acid transport substrate-binding protein
VQPYRQGRETETGPFRYSRQVPAGNGCKPLQLDLALMRGVADFQLLAERVLSDLNRSGRILEIYRRWFGSFSAEPLSAVRMLYQLNSTLPWPRTIL